MPRYCEYFAFKQKTGSETTGIMRIHKFYFDMDEVEDINELAINTNIGSPSGTYSVQLMSAKPRSSTFIHKTIELESTGQIISSEFLGLTNFIPSQACADYGYTVVNNPVYYYTSDGWSHAVRPSSKQIGTTGGGYVNHVFGNTETEVYTNLGTVYCALYGDNEQMIDFLLKYGNRPYVNWRVYCYNPSGVVWIGTRYYDFTINWEFVIDDLLKDYFEVEEVKIALIPEPGPSTRQESIIYNLDYIPNTFSINKKVAYAPMTIWNYPYNLNLYINYKKLTDNSSYQTDRFSVKLDGASDTVEYFEHDVTRIDSNDKSTITFILENPEDDEDYNVITTDSDDSDNPSVIDPSLIVSNVGCGASMYAMTKANFSALVNWLWTSTFIDNIKLINNSPIENIISAQLFPFSISNLSDTTITLGNVDTPIVGEILPSTFNNFHRQLVASYKVESFYNNFLDFSPYTSISIYLPYIGIKPLDANMINGKTLDVYYTFDLSSGACVASIYVDGNVLYMFEGQIGINLPLSASNRAQVDATYVAIGASAVMSIASAWIGASGNIATATFKAEQASKNIDKAWDSVDMIAKTSRTSAGVATGKTVLGSLIDSANVQFHTYTQGTFSPNTWGLLPKDVFMIYNRPTYQDIDTFRHVEGRHCMLSRRIGGLTGYTEVHSSIDLSSIPCDEELKARLKEILVGGFIA